MDKGAFARLIAFVLAWVNQILVSHGYHPLNIDDTTIASIITFVVTLWGFISHNFIGQKGKAQKEVLQQHDLLK